MIKILRITGDMNPAAGGIAQGIRNMASILNEKTGINLTVLSFVEEGSRLKTDNFDHIILGPPQYGWCYDSKLKPFLERNISNFDIIIMNGIWLYPGKALIDTFEKLKKKGAQNLPKLYMMPHGMLDPWFQTASTRRFKAFRNEIYWRLIERKVINNADAVLYTCQKEMEMAQHTFPGYAPQKEINIGYGVPAPPTFQAAFKKAFDLKVTNLQNRPYWLFMSRIHEKKGLDLLVRAYSSLIKNCPNETIPDMVIAGPGENTNYGLIIKKLIQDYANLKGRIHFTGMLTGEAKWGALYGCEAFILPSQQENFGIVVVEALACKKPVLISKEINIWQEIENYQAGLFYDYNQNELYGQLAKFLHTNSDSRAIMGENAYQCYHEVFDIEAKAKDFYDLLIKPILDNKTNYKLS